MSELIDGLIDQTDQTDHGWREADLGVDNESGWHLPLRNQYFLGQSPSSSHSASRAGRNT